MGELSVTLLSKEYPPHVYGGAGVHVEYLARALAKQAKVEVRCFGEQREQDGNLVVRGYPQWEETKRGTDPRFVGAVDAFARSLAMAKDRLESDLVHCHTWYTDMGGVLASQLWGVPYVLTIHSLEPLRPWKAEQLGGGYRLSSWAERSASGPLAAPWRPPLRSTPSSEAKPMRWTAPSRGAAWVSTTLCQRACSGPGPSSRPDHSEAGVNSGAVTVFMRPEPSARAYLV